jgi:hypothetical protein
MLVAVIVTLGSDGSVEGAVYWPLVLMFPHAAPLQPVPETFQVTAVFDVPVTAALNCFEVPGKTATFPGVTETRTVGTIVRLAAADFVGSATLTAFTVTVAGEGATDGVE